MGWVSAGDDGEAKALGDFSESQNPILTSKDGCSTRRIVRSQCRTEEVEPGRFVRKCQKTEQILKNCVGRPGEVVHSKEEYTEEDVTREVVKGSGPLGLPDQEHFDFLGLRSDIEAIERNVFGGVSRFLEAAEEMKNGVFSAIGALPPMFDGEPSTRRGTPGEGGAGPYQAKASKVKADPPQSESGYGDISGLAREV